MNREEWLIQASERLDNGVFKPMGEDVPEFRVSTGLPSSRSLSKKGSKRIGECWHSEATVDNIPQVFISPLIEDSIEVLGILAHEMIHAKGIKGHKKDFKHVAFMIGLDGPMKSTTPSPDLVEKFKRLVIDDIGEYPHAALDPSNRKKQTTRLVKVECQECGYICRTTWKWIESAGPPICPTDHIEMEVQI